LLYYPVSHEQKAGMSGALRLMNIPLEGIHHRGVDDARNIAKILYRLLKDY
jgi:inhibitor of KinA sporulation pathway (predicted exonuclease)